MNKKILYISNMYPSKKYKHYGIFVQNIERDLKDMGYKIDRVVKTKQDFIITKLISYIWFYLKILIKSLFKRYDIIYVHFISHSARTIIKKKAFVILHAHGNDIIADEEKDKKNKKYSQKALELADKVIVPSSYFKEVLERDYKINSNIIEIYPSGGIRFDIMRQLSKEECLKKMNLDLKYQYLGFVSRIEKDKGWDILIDAIEELKKENKFQGKKLLIIGTGNEQELLEEKIKKYHLEEDIIQKQFVSQEELVYYYNAIDVLIFPTKRKSESLGLVGLEAMACKTPLIVCTMYGPKTYATNKNALIYTNPTKETLKNKIEQFYKMTEKEKEEMVTQGLETAKEYDSKLLSSKLKKILK